MLQLLGQINVHVHPIRTPASRQTSAFHRAPCRKLLMRALTGSTEKKTRTDYSSQVLLHARRTGSLAGLLQL